MRQFIVYFPNTEIITEIQAENWELDKDDILSFKKDSRYVGTFNFKNILGFKEIVDEQ